MVVLPNLNVLKIFHWIESRVYITEFTVLCIGKNGRMEYRRQSTKYGLAWGPDTNQIDSANRNPNFPEF